MGLIAIVAPDCLASSSLSLRWSIATTVHPAAHATWMVRFPTRPAPITPTTSPICEPLVLNPCKAIAPRVVNAASDISTSSGTFTAKFLGTAAYSAWQALPSPAQATLSPITKSLTFFPTLTTIPERL